MEAIKSFFFGLKIWLDPKTCGKIPLKPSSNVFECPESKYKVCLVLKKFPQALANMWALPVSDCICTDLALTCKRQVTLSSHFSLILWCL